MPINLQPSNYPSTPAGDLPGNLQVHAESGLSLYVNANDKFGNWFNTATGGLETYNVDNVLNYAIALNEPASRSGIYFGSLVPTLPATLLLLSVMVQAGASPATTDCQYRGRHGIEPLILAFEWDGDGIKTCVPLGKWQNHQTALPEQNAGTSLSRAACILDSLYTARLKLASKQVASVTVDGEQTAFTTPGQIDTAILFWKREVALLSGQRRRVTRMRI